MNSGSQDQAHSHQFITLNLTFKFENNYVFVLARLEGSFFLVVFGSRTFLFDFKEAKAAVSVSSSAGPPGVAASSPLS